MRHGLPSRAGMVAVIAASVLTNGLFLSAGAVLAVSGPTARWALDDGAGTNADDSIGTADGTLAGGATWLNSNAAVGTGALHFDGVDDRVEVASAPALEPNVITLTAWVRAPAASPPTAGQVIVEKGGFDCNGASYGLYVATGGIRFSIRAYDGQFLTAVLTQEQALTTLWDGTWHLVAGQINWAAGGTGGQVNGYVSIDGSPIGSPMFIAQSAGLQNGAIGYSGASSSGLRIGGPVDPSCATDSFHGDIDDVRVYNDSAVAIGSLMPPITTTTTMSGPATAHPEQWVTYTANVSPTPRWGYIDPQIFYDGTWHAWGSPVTPDANGNVSFERLLPTAYGTYPVRASFHPLAQYLASSAQINVVVNGYPTTTTLQITPSPSSPFQNETLTATVSSATIPTSLYPLGSVQFYDVTTATPVLLGTSTLASFATGVSKAVLHVSTVDIGTHKIRAKYIGPDPIRAVSQSADTTLQINKATTSVQLGLKTAPPIETHHSFVLYANVTAPNGVWATSATITFRRVGVSTPICTVAANAAGSTLCTVPAQALGAAQFTATYSGNTRNLASTSPALGVTVVADTVHATGISVQYATFYPITDAYLDTVAIKGTRNEAIDVTIKIYSPAGTLLKTVTIASGTGAYSYAWNGRNSAGTIYAEGKYKVVQTLKDSFGTILTSTLYTTISKKTLYTYTKTISMLGSAMTASGTASGGTITVNTTSGYAKLVAPTAFTSWAGVGYELTLPTATLYKSFYVRMYGRHVGLPDDTRIGAQDFGQCAYVTAATWYESCFDAWAPIASTSSTALYYYKTAGLASNFRSGTKVRLLVSALGGTTYVYAAQMVVTYGVLKY